MATGSDRAENAAEGIGQRFESPLHDEWVASILGVCLGVAFSVCFVTGLVDYLAQHPPHWFHLPTSPINLFRVTQGVHVITGIAAIPLLLAKLWTVWPKLFSWPPVDNVAHAVERLSLIALVGGSLFQLFTGVANIVHWYSPMPFFFPTAHFWTAWIVIGALVIHIGTKGVVARHALGWVVAGDEAGTTVAATSVPVTTDAETPSPSYRAGCRAGDLWRRSWGVPPSSSSQWRARPWHRFDVWRCSHRGIRWSDRSTSPSIRARSRPGSRSLPSTRHIDSR